VVENKVSSYYNIGGLIDTIEGGHFGRVFEATPVARANVQPETVAFKIMKLKHVLEDPIRNTEKEWHSFITETRALETFHKGSSHHPDEMVTEFFDCGYIQVPPEHLSIPVPPETNPPPYYPPELERPMPTYQIESMGTNSKAFTDKMSKYRQDRWRPYIVVERIPEKFYTRKDIDPIEITSELPEEYDRITKRYPTLLVLYITLQFVDLLIKLQENDFVYSDHKVAHTYWDWTNGQLRVIDWGGGTFLDTEQNNVIIAERRRNDCRDLIASVTYPLLTGFKKFSTDGPIPSTGTRVSTRLLKLPIPTRVGGRTLLQPLFDDVAKGTIPDANALHARLESIMVQYSLNHTLPNGTNDANLTKITALYEEYGNLSAEFEKLRQTVFYSLKGDSPIQFKEEIKSLYSALEDLRKSWSIVIK
jgi:serine/threonine protein kinase